MEKFDICFFMTGDTQIFKLVILLILSSSTLIFIPLTLGKLKLTLFVLFYYFGQVIVISLCLGKTYHKKQFKPSKFDKNSRTKRRIWHFRVRTSDPRIAICKSNLSMSICRSLQQFTIQNFPSVGIFVFRETTKFLFTLQAQQINYILLQTVLNCTLFSSILIAFLPQSPTGGRGPALHHNL